jgi:hypothetical protein
MAVEGISSDKPINLGFGWYYLSSAVTNSSDAIASLVKDSGRSVVHTFPAEIHGNYGDSDIGSMIKTIADELAITNGYFVAIAIKELN